MTARPRTRRPRARASTALVLCVAVSAAWLLEQLVHDRPTYAARFGPSWLPLAAAALAATAIVLRWDGRPRLRRLRNALSWGGLLLMVWAAGGLPIDLLRVASRVVPGGIMPHAIDWPGLAARASACAAAVVLARLALESPQDETSLDVPAWYGYAAFVLALPYPALKTCWALGGTVGLRWSGAEGLTGSFALWLPAVPWLLAAALSLLLVPRWRWLPRRLLLAAGWSATVVVAMVGPAACWALASALVRGDPVSGGVATGTYAIVYGSWFLWAIAAAAATRSYQLRGELPRSPVAAPA